MTDKTTKKFPWMYFGISLMMMLSGIAIIAGRPDIGAGIGFGFALRSVLVGAELYANR